MQWKDRCSKFLPNAKVGVIRGSTQQKLRDPNNPTRWIKVRQVNITDEGECDIVIGLIQTLMHYTEDKRLVDYLTQFGMAIIDESRHCSAEKFSTILPLLSFKYILALDGTPKRSDGMDKVLASYIGPVTFAVARTYKTKVRQL